MNLLFRAVAAAALILPMVAGPVAAQNYRGAWGVYGGGIWFSDFNNNGDFDDLPAGFGTADLSLSSGWIAGTQLEYWFGNGRFGIRANGSYTERPFDVDGNGFDEEFGDVNTWLIDGDVMIRLLRPERDRVFAPFLSLGAGVAIYNPAGNGAIVIPESNAFWDDGVFNGDDGGNSETVFATPFGLGLDILPRWNLGGVGLGVRLEVVDHIAWDSPADPIFGDDDFDPVHNVRFTAGVHALFGRLFRERPVAVAPPPPAPPAPAEEMITVCVIDPTLEGGIGEVSAIYVPSTGDTLVIVNGQRVPIEQTARRFRTARDADWYVRGEPLTIRVNGEEAEFVTYGGERVVMPQDLALLGTINGVPVYADADEVQDIMEELEEAREARRDNDLEKILEERDDLREDFEDIEVLYIPTATTGCVFQPVRRVEEVRKVRG